MQRLRVALHDGPLAGQLQLDRLAIEALEQTEVQKRDAPVPKQHEVARMRIARELAVAVQAAEKEAKHDLAEPIALGLRILLQLLEADATNEIGDEHMLVRELADDFGHHDEGMAFEDARQRALVLGLELVVELLGDAIADLRGHALDV